MLWFERSYSLLSNVAELNNGTIEFFNIKTWNNQVYAGEPLKYQDFAHVDDFEKLKVFTEDEQSVAEAKK